MLSAAMGGRGAPLPAWGTPASAAPMPTQMPTGGVGGGERHVPTTSSRNMSSDERSHTPTQTTTSSSTGSGSAGSNAGAAEGPGAPPFPGAPAPGAPLGYPGGTGWGMPPPAWGVGQDQGTMMHAASDSAYARHLGLLHEHLRRCRVQAQEAAAMMAGRVSVAGHPSLRDAQLGHPGAGRAHGAGQPGTYTTLESTKEVRCGDVRATSVFVCGHSKWPCFSLPLPMFCSALAQNQ